MSVPWTPLLGDIQSPGSLSSLAEETAARIAADAVLQAEITAGGGGAVSSVFGRVGAVAKQFGDYDFGDLDNLPSTVAGYGITDVYTKSQSDALYQIPQTTLAGYGITDAYTMLQSDTRFTSGTFSWLYSDQVVRADSASAPGGKFVTWSGTYGVSAGKIVCTTSGNADIAAIDLGAADVDFTAGVNVPNGFSSGGVIFRGTNNTNYLSVFFTPGNSISMYKATIAGFVGTQITTVGDATYHVPNGLNLVRVRVVGSSVKVWFNGTLVINYTLTGPEAAAYTGTFSGFISLVTNTNSYGPFLSAVRPVQTLADYNISDAYTKTASDARFAPIAVPFASITGLPTTLAGYGITDGLKASSVVAADTFAGGAGALSVSSSGLTYTAWAGTWVKNGAGGADASSSGNPDKLVFDTGITNLVMTGSVVSSNTAITAMGFIIRGVDASNFLYCVFTNVALKIFKLDTGVATQLATIGLTGTNGVTYPMQVTCNGNVITASLLQAGSTITVSYTLTGGEIAKYVGTFCGYYASAGGAANSGQVFTNISIISYTNFLIAGDLRWVQSSGGSIYNGVHGATNIQFQVGLGSGQQNAAKFWGSVFFGNNNDTVINSTSSGFMHHGSGTGVTLGLTNGTVHLKAVAAGISSPVAPFIQTTGGAPALSSSAGVAGQHAWDAGFLYICIAANTWMRVAVATF